MWYWVIVGDSIIVLFIVVLPVIKSANEGKLCAKQAKTDLVGLLPV